MKRKTFPQLNSLLFCAFVAVGMGTLDTAPQYVFCFASLVLVVDFRNIYKPGFN